MNGTELSRHPDYQPLVVDVLKPEFHGIRRDDDSTVAKIEDDRRDGLPVDFGASPDCNGEVLVNLFLASGRVCAQ